MADNLILAKDISEAVALKNSESAFLAGGTEINRLGSSVMASTLVGIGRIKELDGISYSEDFTPKCGHSACKSGKLIRIGAMCTFQDIVESDIAPDYLKKACLFMASRTKRNMATIGGNVALKRDDSYLYATLLAAGAKLEMLDKDGNTVYKCCRRYLASEGEFDDNLIKAILLPMGDVKVSSKRWANTAQSHAYLTVSVGIVDGNMNVAVAAKNAGLVNLPEFASELQQKTLTDQEILDMVNSCDKLPIGTDMFGSAEYKKYLLAVTIADLAKQVKGE